MDTGQSEEHKHISVECAGEKTATAHPHAKAATDAVAESVAATDQEIAELQAKLGALKEKRAAELNAAHENAHAATQEEVKARIDSLKSMREEVNKTTADTFKPHLNTKFTLTHDDASFTLELVEVEDKGKESIIPGMRKPFSLMFAGPKNHVLPQQIHKLKHHGELGERSIFLVPVGYLGKKIHHFIHDHMDNRTDKGQDEDDRLYYHAVFN